MISQINLHAITLSDIGGAQKYVLSQALEDKRHNIKTSIVSEDKNGWLLQQAKNNNIAYKVIHSLKRSINPYYDFLTLLELIKLIKQERPTHLYLNSSKIGFLGSLAGKICGLENIIYTVHGWVFNEPMFFLKKYFYILIEIMSAHWKTKLVFINNYDLKIAKELHIGQPQQYDLIKLNINPINFYDKDVAKNKLLEKHPDNLINKKIIGTIANTYPTKNLSAFVKLANELEKYSELFFIIIGDGPETPKLKKIIAEHQLKNILLLGQIENASQYLKAFDLFVLTSIKEGSPYVILEAQQANVPILATPVGGVPEMLPSEQISTIADFAEKIKTFFDL